MALQIAKHVLAVPNTVLFAPSVGEVGHKAFVGQQERMGSPLAKMPNEVLLQRKALCPFLPRGPFFWVVWIFW